MRYSPEVQKKIDNWQKRANEKLINYGCQFQRCLEISAQRNELMEQYFFEFLNNPCFIAVYPLDPLNAKTIFDVIKSVQINKKFKPTIIMSTNIFNSLSREMKSIKNNANVFVKHSLKPYNDNGFTIYTTYVIGGDDKNNVSFELKQLNTEKEPGKEHIREEISIKVEDFTSIVRIESLLESEVKDIENT
jgi:hypothetical protein